MSNETELNPLAMPSYDDKPHFPIDVYTPACITAFYIAKIPPGKYQTSNDPVPNVKFLLASPDGNIRKWTNWMHISYNEKCNLCKCFCGWKPLELLEFMRNSTVDTSPIFTTPLMIFTEKNDKGYARITKIRPARNDEKFEVNQATYDPSYIPFKFVKAYKEIVPMDMAVLKLPDGLKTLYPDDMVDPGEDAVGYH